MRYQGYCPLCNVIVNFEHQYYTSSGYCPVCGNRIDLSHFDVPNYGVPNFAMLREIDNIEKALDRIDRAIGGK